MSGGNVPINSLLNKRGFRVRLFLEGIVVGFVTGTVVVSLRYALEKASILLAGIYHFLGKSSPGYMLGWIVALAVIALILDVLVRREPMISGSGIPHVKGAVMRQLNMNWSKVLLWKFAGGLIAVGSGLSLGREGPSVQLGAAAGQGVNQIFKGPKIEERILITSGASAGLAAAFNAPLAGVVFSLEELHRNFSPPILLSSMAASLTADYLSRYFFGIKPILDFHSLPVLPTRYFALLIGLGLVTGVFGVFFNWSLIKSLQISQKQKIIPKSLLILVPLLLTVPVGLIWPQALGGGNGLIEGIRHGQFTLSVLATLVVVKFLLTMFSYGSGAPGGIFMPLLVIGALTGGIYGDLAVRFVQIDPIFKNNFVVFAMTAYFTAIVKAPVTGSILITEMTGSFQHLPALITAAMTAYVVSDVLKGKPIYDQLLYRLLSKGQNNYLHGSSVNKTVLELAVCLGSTLDGKRIREINWPKGCLLVSVRRGDEELIPNGETVILAGDYLYVLTDEVKAWKVKPKLLEMAGHSMAAETSLKT